MTDTIKTYTSLAIVFAALCIVGPLIDGQPSDTDEARDTAAAAQDALIRAQQQQRLAQAEKAMKVQR